MPAHTRKRSDAANKQGIVQLWSALIKHLSKPVVVVSGCRGLHLYVFCWVCEASCDVCCVCAALCVCDSWAMHLFCVKVSSTTNRQAS